MIPKHALTAKDIHEKMLRVMEQHLTLKTEGHRCRTQQTYDLLLKAAAERSSLQATWADSCGVAHNNTMRAQLKKALPIEGLRAQEAEMNAALQSVLPVELTRHAIEVAMDTHDEPYYGKTMLEYTCRGRAQQGTTRFFRIATAYGMWHEARLTLAVTYVLPDDTLLMVVQRLLARVKALGIPTRVLYLDKGFCNCAIIRYLQQERQPTVIACPIRGKQGGIRALCRGRGSKHCDYTFSDGTQVQLALVDTRVVQGKSKRKQRKWLAFVLIEIHWEPRQVYQRYRRRFGVEVSYRIGRQAKVFTNTQHVALRFFLFGLALLMQNVWVWLRWVLTRQPGQGRPKRHTTLLPFDSFRRLLVRGIERYHPPPVAIEVFLDPKFVIY
jgi:hypothetical protein